MKMKKIFYTIIAVIGILASQSCADMLDTESSSQIENPALDQKTDSVFYAYGILQAMQQLADQYYFQNEVRGDLVATTQKASTHLKGLGDFSADITNKYDSVYLYYKVINNCNYYLKNRRTDLMTGDVYTSASEYIAVASIRAWAYLQLMRNYGSAPYVTEPMTTISEINKQHEFADMKVVLADQAEYLENLKKKWDYQYWEVPTFGRTNQVAIGATSWGTTKYFLPSKCFIPLNVILGDLYLELGEYEQAAKTYYDYLYYAALNGTEKLNVNYAQSRNPEYEYGEISGEFYPSDYDRPQNRSLYSSSVDWDNIYNMASAPGDVITYIPMAVTQTRGRTTEIPEAFGYLYYESSRNRVSKYSNIPRVPETADVQLIPSKEYTEMSTTAPYYYYQEKLNSAQRYYYITSAKLGDARANFVSKGEGVDSSSVYVQKPANGNVYLYRTSTVYLHLAEAFNRMGHPDAAFAILKDGISATLNNYVDTLYYHQSTSTTAQTFEQENFYITSKTAEMLNTKVPFLSPANATVFPAGTHAVGIHFHGAGAIAGLSSTYQYSTVVADKIKQLNEKFTLGIATPTLQDSINAVEDILCDEYAMEFAFEGTRFSDLQRIARHKNESGLYGGNFGSIWLTDKLKGNNPVKSLMDPKNWYLPFK